MTTYHLRSPGPGWTPEALKADFLLMTRGDANAALDLACQALSKETRGGYHAPPPSGETRELKLDTEEPVL